jgi:hypothetical protein
MKISSRVPQALAFKFVKAYITSKTYEVGTQRKKSKHGLTQSEKELYIIWNCPTWQSVRIDFIQTGFEKKF